MIDASRIRRGAFLSSDGKYRYILHRTWAHWSDRRVLWVMLNPSTADDKIDDPTIRRCMNYTDVWGYDTMAVVNLFAYRATDPQALKALDPLEAIGPQNNLIWIMDWVQRLGGIVIAGWGQHGKLNGRAAEVKTLAQAAGIRLHALRLAKDGSPYHPLYLKGDLKPFLMME